MKKKDKKSPGTGKDNFDKIFQPVRLKYAVEDKTNSICQRLAIAVDRIEAQLLRLENF